MKGVFRVILPMLLVLGLANGAEARKKYYTGKSTTQSIQEDDGAFMGLGVGYGGIDSKFTLYGTEANNSQNASGDVLFKGGGVALDFLVGYKHFFIKYVGLRYYANVDFLIANFKRTKGDLGVNKADGKGLFGDKSRKVNLASLEANIDLLINFISNDSVDFGMFVGAGIGGNWWIGKGLDELQSMANAAFTQMNSPYRVDIKSGKFYFNASLNAGIRVNIAKHHGLEFVAKVPFIKSTIAEKKGMKNSNGGSTDTINLTMKFHNPYRVMLRYAYNF